MQLLRLAAIALVLATPAQAQQTVPEVVREQTAGPFLSAEAVTLGALLLFALIIGSQVSGDD